jgi:hypothetical protein
MPYGTISNETRAYVEMRAREGNVLDRIDLESDAVNAYTLDVVYLGALDESFPIGRDYAVNVADWIAELLESQVDSGELETCFWEVYVTELGGCGDAYDVYSVKGFSEGDF